MKSNDIRHLEHFEMVLLLWEELKGRKALDQFHDAFESEFIRLFYFQGLKLLALRFDDPPYDFFVNVLKIMKEIVPDWRSNRYLDTLLPVLKTLLDIGYRNISKNEFNEIIELMREAPF